MELEFIMKRGIAIFVFSAFILGGCGESVEKGLGAQKSGDYKTAMEIFTKLTEKGDLRAQFELGRMYVSGEGVATDIPKGVALISKAAHSGSAEAQYFVGSLYQKDGSHQEAVAWYRKAANQGVADAQYGLGLYYQAGVAVEKDLQQAAQWYRKAADSGNVEAQNTLGALYALGEGVPQSNALAIDWLRKAAQQGHSGAQFGLGLLYCGQSCEFRNDKTLLSYVLFSLAAAANVKGAASYRDDIAAILSPAELSQGQAAAASWKKGTPLPNLKTSTERNVNSKEDKDVSDASTTGTVSREEFKMLVVGKTPQQVMQAVGKPENTNESSSRVSWTYRYRTVDPVSGNTDQMAIVVFLNGAAHHVIF